MRSYDAWLTSEPQDFDQDEPTVTCPADCTLAADGTPQEFLRSALAWEAVTSREVPVWGCGGLTPEYRENGIDVAGCGSSELHERHMETTTARTFKGRCPVCGEEIRFEEEVF